MRRYRFRLEKLLRLQERLEEIQRIETLQQEQETLDAMQYRDALSLETSDLRNQLTPPIGEKWEARDQHTRYRYHIRLIQQTYLADVDLQKKREELAKKRQALVERSRERKTLEKLGERHFEIWREEAQHEEQNELDEVGSIRKARQKKEGKIILTSLLLLSAIALTVLCGLTWVSWIKNGKNRWDFIQAPFDQVEQKKAIQEIRLYEEQQRVKREKKLKEQVAMPEQPQTALSETVDKEGFRNTVQRILQKEESLRKKEESLDAMENSIMAAEEDLKREMTRLNNIQKRISSEIEQLRELEKRRKAEMTADRKAKMDEINKAVQKMTPKRAASLLFSVAFPNPESPITPPIPLGQDLEGLDLVIAVLNQMPSNARGEILDAMTKTSPEKTAVIFDRLDNIKTGLEEDRYFPEEQAKTNPAG